MKNKIIVTILIMLGFGSCCNRPSKSKRAKDIPEEVTIEVDTSSVPDIRVMYGPPRGDFEPIHKIRDTKQEQEPENTEIQPPSTSIEE